MYFLCTAEIWISKSEQRNAHLYMDTWKQICTTHWHLPVKEGTIGKDRCSLSWIHQTEAMYLPSYQESYQTLDKAYLGKDLSAGKDRLFKHQTKGQSANGWIERLNDSYFTLHWVFLSSSMMARAFWPARAISHREPADQYALQEQTLDWRAEFSK